MDTLVSLHRKIDGATDLKAVVKTMKAVAASNIGQYENAIRSLGDYNRTVGLGIVAYFKAIKLNQKSEQKVTVSNNETLIGAVVFGSDQGLVGRFNDSITKFAVEALHDIPGKKEIWAVGERVQSLLEDTGFTISKLFSVPNSVNAITPLVGQVLINAEQSHEKDNMKEFYIFHNQPNTEATYVPVMQRLLPLDTKWRHYFDDLKWPTNKIPQIAGGLQSTLRAIIREYLFASLFRACAESLDSENASRLAAMQRAEKNIGDMLDGLNKTYHRLRQDSIDEELFDVVSGFEALKYDKINQN